MTKLLILRAFLIGVVLAPIAAVITFLLLPVWRWVEARYGVESIGHSGPSDWCYYLVYGVLLALITGLWVSGRRAS